MMSRISIVDGPGCFPRGSELEYRVVFRVGSDAPGCFPRGSELYGFPQSSEPIKYISDSDAPGATYHAYRK